jgi:hypothetical protein
VLRESIKFLSYVILIYEIIVEMSQNVNSKIDSVLKAQANIKEVHQVLYLKCISIIEL